MTQRVLRRLHASQGRAGLLGGVEVVVVVGVAVVFGAEAWVDFAAVDVALGGIWACSDASDSDNDSLAETGCRGRCILGLIIRSFFEIQTGSDQLDIPKAASCERWACSRSRRVFDNDRCIFFVRDSGIRSR